MSVINRMLQELDRRQGLATADGTAPGPEVRAVAALPAKEGEWFWRIVAALMVCALGWVGWVAWQLQPTAIVTDKGILAAEDARRRPAPVEAPASTQPVVVVPVPVAAAEPPRPAAPVEPMRLATAIQAPVVERPAKAVTKPAPAAPTAAASAPAAPSAPPVAAAAQTRKLDLDFPQARIIPAPAGVPSRVVKQDKTRSPAEKAEFDFRRGVGLLNQGRGSEAEEAFATAIAGDVGHEGARQALVALRIENGRVEEARRLLQEGLAVNRANAQFATALAQILAQRREYAAALEVLNGASAAGAGNAGYQMIRATVLQRLSRNGEAAEAFQSSLRVQPANAQAWIGLGIALEAQQKRPEAAEAFSRALEAGPIAGELRSYAEQRIRALR